MRDLVNELEVEKKAQINDHDAILNIQKETKRLAMIIKEEK